MDAVKKRFVTQDPKYAIEVTVEGTEVTDAKLVNSVSGSPIPADEPVMMFRAKDRFAHFITERYHDDLVSYMTEKLTESNSVGRIYDGQSPEYQRVASSAERVTVFKEYLERHPDQVTYNV